MREAEQLVEPDGHDSVALARSLASPRVNDGVRQASGGRSRWRADMPSHSCENPREIDDVPHPSSVQSELEQAIAERAALAPVVRRCAADDPKARAVRRCSNEARNPEAPHLFSRLQFDSGNGSIR